MTLHCGWNRPAGAKPGWTRATAAGMAMVMLLTALPLMPARAGMVGTAAVIEGGAVQRPEAVTPGARERVQAVLARDDIRAELAGLGIAPAEAEARLAALTDAEVEQLAGRLDSLPAGEGTFSIVLIIFFVFGVLVLLDALGLADVFNFVCGPGQCVQRRQALATDPAADIYAQEPAAGYYDQAPTAYYRRDRRQPWPEGQSFSEQDYYRGQAPIQQTEQGPYDLGFAEGRDYNRERTIRPFR